MPVWAVLVGGTLGFYIGCTFGNNKGFNYWLRKRHQRGWVNYRLAFIEGLILGFSTLLIAQFLSHFTNFLPAWVNAFLWTAALGTITGWPVGFYTLGPNRDARGASNIQASESQATLGAFLGLVACVFLTSIF
jgi:hypothetical protein